MIKCIKVAKDHPDGRVMQDMSIDITSSDD